MEDFRRMIIKVSDVEGASATIPVSNDHTDGSWLITDIYEGELFLNLIDNILQTRTDAGIINLNASSSSDADRVVQDVRYDEGVEKGEPLIITGYNVGSGIITVEKADASASAEMPSYGLAMANYSSGATGQMITVGTLTDVDTSAFSEGDTVYVAVGGGLTNVKPIEPNLIQNVGFVARSNVNNGSIEVVAIGRANDVPNLPVGHTFIGTATNPTTIDLTTELNSKQDTLVSGTNIKTIAGTSILGSGDIPLDNDFTSLNDTPEDYTGSGGYAVQVNAGETGLEFVASGGGGGSAQIFSYIFSSNHSGNNTSFYYVFRNKSNSNMVTRFDTWTQWAPLYYVDLTMPADCFLKSFTIRGVDSAQWPSGLQIRMKIFKNRYTVEYNGSFVTSSGSGDTGQITFNLTSSDTSFSAGDVVGIGFNTTGNMGGIIGTPIFELT